MKAPEARLAWALGICTRAHMRVTPLRRAILEFLAGRRVPATLEIIAQAEGIAGTCDGTTIYRTLMLFKDAEIVRLLGLPHKASSFLLNVPGENRHFLICRRCGCITELQLPLGVAAAVRELAQPVGFSGENQDHEIHGLCQPCAAARRREPIASKLRGRPGR